MLEAVFMFFVLKNALRTPSAFGNYFDNVLLEAAAPYIELLIRQLPWKPEFFGESFILFSLLFIFMKVSALIPSRITMEMAL